MTDNALTTLDQRPQLPAEYETFFDEESNILPKQTVPTLSYEGKVWTIGLNGEKTKLLRKNSEGDDEPVSVMRVVVLDYNQHRGRAYYEGAYDPTKASMPACWSEDGIAPSSSVKEPQNPVCSKCPMSIKGSKITEQNKQVTACSEHRMVVVIPVAKNGLFQLDGEHQPLRMKIAITSDWDGQSPDHEKEGWLAFKNYTDMLRARNVKHTAEIVTKMKFDPNVAYPKVLFAYDRWLTPDQLGEVIPLVKSDRVATLAAGTWTPNGIDGEKIDPVEEVAETAKADPAAKAKLKAKAAATAAAAEAKARAAAADDEGDIELPSSTKAAAPAAGKAAGAKAPPKGANGSTKSTKTAAPPAEAPAEAVESDLSDLLNEWA